MSCKGVLFFLTGPLHTVIIEGTLRVDLTLHSRTQVGKERMRYGITHTRDRRSKDRRCIE